MGADVYGDWFPLNVARARAYLEASAAAGYRPALATLSLNNFWGGGFKGGNEINFFKAAEYAELANKAQYVQPFDDGMTQLLPITYRSLNQGTMKLLSPDSEFVNSLDAAVSSQDGEDAYQAGRYLTEFHNEARDAADYFYKIAAARGHVGGILEHAKYIYFGPGLGYDGPTTDSFEARELFEIAAAKGSVEAKEFLNKYKSRASNEAKRKQAMFGLAAALAAFLALAEEPSVADPRKQEYEARQRQLQYQINTDLAFGVLTAP
ncbi:MAG: hypothetical protein WBA90_15635 [Albidovulum sp.]